MTQTQPLAKDFANLLAVRNMMMSARVANDADDDRARVARWISGLSAPLACDMREEAGVRRFYPDVVRDPQPIFYLHGGGLVYYSTAVFAPFLSALCQQTGREIYAFDYPKAPETPMQDCVDALERQLAEWITPARPFTGKNPARGARAARGVPLFLPAATASHLTRNATTWRLCDNDADYVAWLGELMTQAQWAVAPPEHDGSLHGISVAEQLADWLDLTPYGATRVFSGRYAASVRYAIRWAHTDLPGRLILTDDAGSTALVPDLLAHGVDPDRHDILIAGICPHPAGDTARHVRQAWRRRWGGEPGTYLWETLSALQTAARYPELPARTVLGPLRFDEQRESRPSSFRLWRVTRHGLVAWQPATEAV
ncbi:hypothetical protein BN133_3370 [Cronobacter dublinensis 582]|nr:hypothetical protein BN133_3370 [Cronobacter dublinensis 582]